MSFSRIDLWLMKRILNRRVVFKVYKIKGLNKKLLNMGLPPEPEGDEEESGNGNGNNIDIIVASFLSSMVDKVKRVKPPETEKEIRDAIKETKKRKKKDKKKIRNIDKRLQDA